MQKRREKRKPGSGKYPHNDHDRKEDDCLCPLVGLNRSGKWDHNNEQYSLQQSENSPGKRRFQ